MALKARSADTAGVSFESYMVFMNEIVNFLHLNAPFLKLTKTKYFPKNVNQLGESFSRPLMPQSRVTRGRVVTDAEYDAPYQRNIMSTINDDDYMSVCKVYASHQITDPQARTELVRSISEVFIAELEKRIITELLKFSSQCVRFPIGGDITNGLPFREARNLLHTQELNVNDMHAVAGCASLNDFAKDISDREHFAGATESVYRGGALGRIGGVMLHEASLIQQFPSQSSSTYRVSGAGQGTIPRPNTGGDGHDAKHHVDARYGTLLVSNGTALTAKVGDKFFIANVEAVSNHTKLPTGSEKIFTISKVTDVSATSQIWDISPPLIPLDGTDPAQKFYANVDTTPADNAVISFMNRNTRSPIIFFQKDAIELITTDLPMSTQAELARRANGGGTYRSLNGILPGTDLRVSMLYDTDINRIEEKIRVVIQASPEVVYPESAGLILIEQNY